MDYNQENTSQGTGTGDKADPMEFFSSKMQKTIDDFNLVIKNTQAGMKQVFIQAAGQLNTQLDQARALLQAGLAELLEKQQQKQQDWRETVIRRFADWLYNLTEAEFSQLNTEAQQELADSPPDFLTFFNELGSLKQEIKLQTQAARGLTEKTDTILEQVKQEFNEQGDHLEHTAAELKAQLPRARREGENHILMEFIKIRDALEETLACWQNRKAPKKSWLHRQASELPEVVNSLQLLLHKIDDAFNRLHISCLCREGMPFDADVMRVLATSREEGKKSGTVTRVIRQGYKKDGQLLQLAEVQVQQ